VGRVVWSVAALALILLGVSGVSGCSDGTAAAPGWPAGAAGGACQLLDYAVVADATGTRFDTAGAAQADETYTCALTQQAGAFPDLILAVTASHADAVIFTATVTPSGSDPVEGLGQVAYKIKRPGADATGPQAEVGWLSDNARIMFLRYTFPAKTSDERVDAMLPKLVNLAKTVDAVGA
jgi:hypothetical protein